MKTNQARSVGVSFPAMVTQDGTPFLNGITSCMQPKGVEIVGNGTLSHPLNVKLTGAYLAAPDLLEACKLLLNGAEQAQRAGVNQPQLNGGIVLARAALKKAGAQ